MLFLFQSVLGSAKPTSKEHSITPMSKEYLDGRCTSMAIDHRLVNILVLPRSYVGNMNQFTSYEVITKLRP